MAGAGKARETGPSAGDPEPKAKGWLSTTWSYYLAGNSEGWLNGRKVGLEPLFFNGLFLFGLLWLFSTKSESAASQSGMQSGLGGDRAR